MTIDTSMFLSESVREDYKAYLADKYPNLPSKTIDQYCTDTFYPVNNGSDECFCEVMTAEDFDTAAKATLTELLPNTDNLNQYLSRMREFRNYVEANKDRFSLEASMTALTDFETAIENGCLDELSDYVGGFNIFDVLRIVNTEIRHSNMLAWLFDPNGSHGMGSRILERFCSLIGVPSHSHPESFTVYREDHNIDVLIVSDKEKLVICVENKIHSGEHGDQLNDYRSFVEDNYGEYRRFFVFLSPDGVSPSDPENWSVCDYGEILRILEEETNKTKPADGADLLIRNYIDILRRRIVKDKELIKKCREIYARHKTALDLIYENRFDSAAELKKIFIEWAAGKARNGEIIFSEKQRPSTYTRFLTEGSLKLFPDSDTSKSNWGERNHHFYEIVYSGGNEFFLKLTLCVKKMPQEYLDTANRIELFYHDEYKCQEDYRVPRKWRSVKLADVIDGDFVSRDKVFAYLDEDFNSLMAFERDLLEKMEKLKD